MMFNWTPDMIRFMRDASEYGDYNKKIAELVVRNLPKSASVCDAGCGLGYLSLALSEHVKNVTAVDIKQEALAVLRENIAARGIKNIEVKCADINNLPEESSFDAMVFCFFGGLEEILDIAKKHCHGTVFMAKKNYDTHRFSVGKHKQESDSLKGTCESLQERRIPFKCRELSLEFGQPFRSMDDARLFFETYSRDKDLSRITERFLSEKLEETGRKDFPLYLPHKRDIGWIEIETEAISGYAGKIK